MSPDDLLHEATDVVSKPCCSEETGLNRRSFMKIWIGFLALLWGSAAVYPILKYIEPSTEGSKAQVVKSLTVGQVTDFPKGSAKNFKFGSQPALLYRDLQGDFHAFNAVCTHLGCTVQYKNTDDTIFCACHGGVYEAKSGVNISGPPPKPLTALKVEVMGDDIVVSKV